MPTATASALSASRLAGGAAHLLPPPPLAGPGAEAGPGELERMAEELAALQRRLQELEGH